MNYKMSLSLACQILLSLCILVIIRGASSSSIFNGNLLATYGVKYSLAFKFWNSKVRMNSSSICMPRYN
uniref:Uncharacterized protein n=1 Tax=Setaria viridis TaxID=4556 RepID=A0A4U6SY57_SETVI|nr:hypothetical protein SEVIR_9G211466v2 [Setaria viridis]